MVPLTELAMTSPLRAQALGSLPSLSSIRGPIERLVTRLNIAAKVEAESQLAQALKLLESAGAKELVIREIRAQNLVLTAGRLLDAGGYPNAVWSAQLSQLVIDPRLWAPNAVPVPLPLKIKDADGRSPAAGSGVLAAIGLVCAGLQLKSRIRRMWFRAPLLVLLLAWFVVGLTCGAISALVRNYWPRLLSASLIAGSFELWALGFLVLVAVGLYVSVRNV
jgi:hypothetical protein